MHLFKTVAFASTGFVCALMVGAFASAASDTGVSRTFPQGHPSVGLYEAKPSIGLSAGIADTQEGRRSATGYGIEYGAQPYIPMGVAVELGGYVSDRSGNQATLTRTKLLLKGNYNFGGNLAVIRYSYIGLGAGPVLDNVANKTDVELGIAPQVGFDIPITNSPMSLGANANYMFVGGAKADVFAVNGVAKYWF